MICIKCNGIGLLDKKEGDIVYAQEVCFTCNGTGNDGIEVVTFAEKEVPEEPKKAVKRKKK